MASLGGLPYLGRRTHSASPSRPNTHPQAYACSLCFGSWLVYLGLRWGMKMRVKHRFPSQAGAQNLSGVRRPRHPSLLTLLRF